MASSPPHSFPKLKREINRDTQRGWIVSTEKDFIIIRDLVSDISKGEYVAKKKEEVIAERKVAKGITRDSLFRTTVLTGSAANQPDLFYERAVAYNRGLGKISGKMEFHSTYTQNGHFILKIELDSKGLGEFEKSDEGGPDSTLYLFSRGSFKLTANPRFGGSGARRSAGAVGVAAAEMEQGSSGSSVPLDKDMGSNDDKDCCAAASSSAPVPTISITPAQPSKRRRQPSSPNNMPLPEEDTDTSAAADPPVLNSNVPSSKLNAPNDKRSRKSDDEESDVDSEVQRAASGLSGGSGKRSYGRSPRRRRVPPRGRTRRKSSQESRTK